MIWICISIVTLSAVFAVLQFACLLRIRTLESCVTALQERELQRLKDKIKTFL